MSKVYVKKITGQTFILWTIALFFSFALNLAMLTLMPGLIHSTPELRKDFENIDGMSVIRVKRNEAPVTKRKPKKAPPKPEKTKKQLLKTKTVYMNKPVQQKIRLPFQLNPKLPVGAQTLEMPPMEMMSINAPDLKTSYGSHEIDNPLTPIVKIPPVYPMRARRRAIEGWVKVNFLVNEQGNVENVNIIEADPENIFEQSVIRCVSKWRFKPGTVDGVPVKTLAETTVKFELNK